jgi:hypothetical protein
MQPITWNKDELQSSINRKLAVLRANRAADKGLPLEQRLSLAEERIAFEEAGLAADRRRNAGLLAQQKQALQYKAIVQTPRSPAAPGLFMSRVDEAMMSGNNDDCADFPRDSLAPAERHDRAQTDLKRTLTDSFAAKPEAAGGNKNKGSPKDQKPSILHDSHATSIKLNPKPDKPFVPHAVRYAAAQRPAAAPSSKPKDPLAMAQKTTPTGNQRTEVPADKVQNRPPSLYGPDVQEPLQGEELAKKRLIEQTQRQSDTSWQVLDRATVLSSLASQPGGFTMVQLAFKLLGAAASPRDTRRLAALMKREEQRETVTLAGRGKPITLTAAGRAALAQMDVEQNNALATERRQKRILAQQRRLTGQPPPEGIEPVKKPAKAPKRLEKASKPPAEPYLKPKKASTRKNLEVQGRLVLAGKVVFKADGKDSAAKPQQAPEDTQTSKPYKP